jgi:hypothetical protein
MKRTVLLVAAALVASAAVVMTAGASPSATPGVTGIDPARGVPVERPASLHAPIPAGWVRTSYER